MLQMKTTTLLMTLETTDVIITLCGSTRKTHLNVASGCLVALNISCCYNCDLCVHVDVHGTYCNKLCNISCEDDKIPLRIIFCNYICILSLLILPIDFVPMLSNIMLPLYAGLV